MKLLGNYDRPTNQPINRPTDRTSHSEVTLPIRGFLIRSKTTENRVNDVGGERGWSLFSARGED